ncbi:hypothetical protein C7T94_03485 [Pedobacter yulinensis]|uniref:Lipocalin-like domain-containing protein n=1 Tax=Pedobacter yulinensis TaxID=2126353 RepID=A0A2T3HRX8_9SPHI|nr:hypothetical protein [Pedobacter yulinensis]PST85179.1 hypothetical protein C7T94_03485 [Pedobacter yulinensis]
MNRKIMLFLFVLAAAAGSCKRIDPQPQHILKMHPWKLNSAVSLPGRTVHGSKTTDLFALDPQGCLANNYTLRFDTDSTCRASSNGALCDMIAGPITWRQTGDELFLGEAAYKIKALDNSKMVLVMTADTRTGDGVQTVTYTYSAEDK